MNKKAQVYTVRGKVMYAKVLGDPQLNYNKDGKEWSLDLIVSPEVVKEFKTQGIGDRVKKKDDKYGGQPHIRFRQKELRADGSKNEPIKVVDILNKAWDSEKMIGNDSVVDIKYSIRDYGVGKKAGVYPQVIRVLDHVPYEGGGSIDPINEEDEYYKKALAAQEAALATSGGDEEPVSEDLDDEIPF